MEVKDNFLEKAVEHIKSARIPAWDKISAAKLLELSDEELKSLWNTIPAYPFDGDNTNELDKQVERFRVEISHRKIPMPTAHDLNFKVII